MLKLICNSCQKKWYADDDDLKEMSVCPYCADSMRKEKKISVFDTIDKVIYKSILDYGMGVFDTPKKLYSILADMLPDQGKEIKILSRVSDSNLIIIKNAFEFDQTGFDTEMQKLRFSLTEDDGYSDAWAGIFCSTFEKVYRHVIGVDQGFVDNFTAIRCVLEKEKKINKSVESIGSNLIDESTHLSDVTEEISKRFFNETYPIIRFGKYPQTENGNDKTPIEWIVLHHYYDKALLISKYGLFFDRYNRTLGNISWGKSSVREKLNRDFLNDAFDPVERLKMSISKCRISPIENVGFLID